MGANTLAPAPIDISDGPGNGGSALSEGGNCTTGLGSGRVLWLLLELAVALAGVDTDGGVHSDEGIDTDAEADTDALSGGEEEGGVGRGRRKLLTLLECGSDVDDADALG